MNQITNKGTSMQNIREWYIKKIKPNTILYLFLIPVLIYAAIFWYAPMFGLVMSFQRYNPGLGFLNSPWVGFEHFKLFFSSYMFGTLIKNTLRLSIYSLLAGIPLPIILALAFQYCRSHKFAKTVQTVTYAPYFISVVVLVSMLSIFLSPSTGLVNHLISKFGGDSIYFMVEKKIFSHIYVWSGIWQGAGWGSIIYTAALAGSNPQLHDAAVIDGASKWQRVVHIDFPILIPTFLILMILNIGHIMSVGYEKVYLMQNSGNIMVSQIISTYTYSIGVLDGEISYATAIGLFNNVINFILIFVASTASKKITQIGVI